MKARKLSREERTSHDLIVPFFLVEREMKYQLTAIDGKMKRYEFIKNLFFTNKRQTPSPLALLPQTLLTNRYGRDVLVTVVYRPHRKIFNR